MNPIAAARRLLCPATAGETERLNRDYRECVKDRRTLAEGLEVCEQERSAAEARAGAVENELEGCEQRLREALDERDDLADERREATTTERADVEPQTVGAGFVAEALRTIPGWEDISIRLPMNGEYKVLTRGEFDEVVALDATHAKEYELHHFDCVDFTGVFRFTIAKKYRINSIGTVLSYSGTPHAFNVVVFADGTAELFEPQTEEFVTDHPHEMYDLDGAVVHV